MKNMFWGVVIILIGVLVVLNSVFGINLPIFKILFGLLLIYWGIKVLFGGFSSSFEIQAGKRSTDREAVFANSTFKYPHGSTDGDAEYVTVFGSSELDLSGLTEMPAEPLELVAVFGKAQVIVKKGTPLVVESQTVFGASHLPEDNKNAFGDFTYRSSSVKDGVTPLVLKTQVVFGSFEIIEKD